MVAIMASKQLRNLSDGQKLWPVLVNTKSKIRVNLLTTLPHNNQPHNLTLGHTECG